MMGSLDHVKRRLIVHTSRTKRSATSLRIWINSIASWPQARARDNTRRAGQMGDPVSKIALTALDARKHWLTVEWLPKYSPSSMTVR